MKSDIKLKLVVVRGKKEWLLEVFTAFGICNQTKLIRSKFFFYKIGLKGVFSSFGYSNLMINRDPCSVKNSGQYSFV